ncbi:MAG: hypothetical protein Kow0047_06620 [Anaerolineae bacterium]
MKVKRILFTLSLVALPAATLSPGWTAGDKIVAAYYFYWYDIYTNLHFIDPDGSDALTDHPPDAYWNDYSYTLVSWHRRELLDMMAAQIDVVLPVYWGDDTDLFYSIPGLQNLVLAEQELISEGYTPPRIGMFYDTTALRVQNGDVPPDITTPAGKALFYGMMADFFDVVPQELWATIDGRPIVFLYLARFVSAYHQSTFDYVNQHFQADFGTTPYIVRELSWEGVETDGVYPWGVALMGPAAIGHVGSVGPGYDESAVYGLPDPQFRDRECGQFYEEGWDAILSSAATLVSIETWNEFHEGTDIAASREYSRTYITLTAQNVQRWKASDYSGVPLVWMDLGRYTYMGGLRPAFNYPDGAWLVTLLAGREAAYPDHTTDPASYYIYLDVHDAFAHAAPTEVWVTVEYFDGGNDQWWLEYDATTNPYRATSPVQLHNTGQWKRHTFHLTDAYFGGRQNGGADLRLSDLLWADGRTNYFGRVWISRSAPGNRPPDLTAPANIGAVIGRVTEIPISAADPDGSTVALTVDRGTGFATLIDNGDGTGVLRLAPTEADHLPCPYRVRLLATDAGNPPLADAATIRVFLCEHQTFLPLVRR